MHVYRPDPAYTSNKSYSRADKQRFSTEVLAEAIRIKRLLLKAPGFSTRESFQYLLKNGILSAEELLGIEHLVLTRSTSKVLKDRKDHAKSVVAAQIMMQRMQQTKHPMKNGRSSNHAEKLGEFAASQSLKSVKKARIRAAMAA